MSPPSWQYWPDEVAGNSNYSDKFIAGSDYWIIAAGSNPTDQFAPTAGSGDTNFAGLRLSTQAGNTAVTASGNITLDTYFQYCVQGGFGQLSNSYTYCATYHDGVVTSGNNATPDGPGWVIWETETVAGTLQANRQSYAPLEAQSGVVIDSSSVTQTGSGYGPIWSRTLVPAVEDSFVFFFNSYTPGEVQSWSAWDGVSVP